MASGRTPIDWVIKGSRDAAEAADPRYAVRCVLDWIGVALAGAAEPTVAVAARAITPGGHGPAGVIWRPNRGTPWDVALVNGTAGHALDYDDTHVGLPGHPTAPVLPALLAIGEAERATGPDLLAALAAGIEAECRVAAIIGPDHYAAGFHTTSTIGVFGAAAGAAQLMGLADGEWRHAIALAASHAAGLKAQFGTMAKALQVGRAAAAGVRCALLASEGFTAAPDGVEAFASVYGTTPIDLERADEALGSSPAVTGVIFKRHASCHLTHATIENAVRIRAEGFPVEDIERVVLRVSEQAHEVCGSTAPETGLQAKFSLQVTAALGLLGDDTADPSTFTDGRVTDPDVVALRDRVDVRVATGAPSTTWSTMLVQGRDGRRAEAETDAGLPHRETDDARLRAKAVSLARSALGPDRADAVVAAVTALPDGGDVASLLRATRP